MKRSALCLVLTCTLGSAWVARAAKEEVYVSPRGDDGNPGTLERPLKTLEAARDVLRQRPPPEEGTTVWLRGGTYRRENTFELDERDSHTTYRAYRTNGTKERVSIVGGVPIPASAVQRVTRPAVLERVIEEDARLHLRRIDLRALGITDYGELGPRGFRRAYIPAPLELFIEGKAQQIARWPNEGERHIPMGNVADAGSKPREGDYSFRAGTFEYGVDRPTGWTKARDLHVSGLFSKGYADDTIQVAEIDTAAGTFTTTHPHMYGFARQSFCSWYALNLLEEIDVPGEYFVDKTSGVLYFYPPAGFDASSALSVSLLEEPMVALEGVTNGSFESITFEITRGSGIYIERGASNVVAACTLRNMGIVAVQIGKGIAPFPYGKHDGCGNKADGRPGRPVSRQMGSWHEHIYKYTAWNREAGVDHRVIGCDIYDIGAGGISLGGGDRKTLIPANNAVINCDIYRVNRWDRTYKAPVNIDGVGNKVVHCHLHHCPGIAVYLHGNDHLIAYNEIDHVLTDMSDMGSIYMGRDPSETGNLFRHNFFHHIRNYHKGGHGVQAIFFDDCSVCGAEIEGNVFYRAGSNCSIKFNGGGVCDIVNNVFVDCPQPVGGIGNHTGRVRKFMAGTLGKERLRHHVDITIPPYSERYPRLLSIYQHKTPVVTQPECNYVVKDDHSQFVDAGNLDFRLKGKSKVYEDIPGFRPIPFAAIGLVADEYRETLTGRAEHLCN